MQAGHDARGADLYGVLLACYDLVLNDRSGFEPGELEQWGARLPSDGGESIDGDEADHLRCLQHLLSSAPTDFHHAGVRQTIGQLIEKALDSGSLSEANSILETAGVKVTRDQPRGRGLFVATAHPGLSLIFHGTHWGGGGSRTGSWSQALPRVPGATSGPAQRFAGVTIKTSWVPAFAIEEDGQ